MTEISEQQQPEQSRGRTVLGCFILVALAVLLTIGGIGLYDMLKGDGEKPSTATGGLLGEIAALPVADEHDAGYDRELFGDYDRERILDRNERRFPCRGYYSRYDDQCHRSPDAVHADHAVALSEAWDSGAWQWDQSRRDEFAADPANLAVMTARLNISKSDADPAEWLPEHRRCAYVETWVKVKAKYELTIDDAERAALTSAAEGCAS